MKMVALGWGFFTYVSAYKQKKAQFNQIYATETRENLQISDRKI